MITDDWATSNNGYLQAYDSVGDITINPDFTNGISAPSADISGSLTVDGQDVGEFMREMKERMLVLEPDFQKHELYPALKDAYEHYKTIEALLRDG